MAASVEPSELRGLRPDASVGLRPLARYRCRYYGRSSEEVADLVLAEHDRRRRNPREADWLVAGRGLVVAYNWPDGEDFTTARVVTLWPQR